MSRTYGHTSPHPRIYKDPAGPCSGLAWEGVFSARTRRWIKHHFARKARRLAKVALIHEAVQAMQTTQEPVQEAPAPEYTQARTPECMPVSVDRERLAMIRSLIDRCMDSLAA